MPQKPELKGIFKEIVDSLNKTTETLLAANEKIKASIAENKLLTEKWNRVNAELKSLNEKMRASLERFQKLMGEISEPHQKTTTLPEAKAQGPHTYAIFPPKETLKN